MKKRILGLALAMLLLFCAAALGETNTQVKHYLMLGEDGYADQVTDDARTVPSCSCRWIRSTTASS